MLVRVDVDLAHAFAGARLHRRLDLAQARPRALQCRIGPRPEGRDFLLRLGRGGLDDLFGLVVRANKAQITRAIYEAKLARWRQFWPSLRFVAW